MKTCTLDGDCTEEDVGEVLHWIGGTNGNGVCTNSNPTFVGVLSLNLENHLLPTFQKCLCFFYTLKTRERASDPPVSTPRFFQKKKKKETKNKKRTTETSLHNCCATNENGPFPLQMDVVKDLCNWY